MTRYTTVEACQMTGISKAAMTMLLRNNFCKFRPTWPGSCGRGKTHYFSKSDIELLTRYKKAVTAHRELLEEMRKTKRRSK